jgi:TRAP-type C4-dicarboxylate transport system permease small subunit
MKRLSSLFAAVTAIALFAMMVLTFVDVIGRKIVGNSLPGAVELTEIFMMLMIFFALPLASLAGEHIVFDLLDRVMPPRALAWQKVVSHALSGLIMLGSSWVVAQRAARTMEFGDTTARLEIRLGPFHWMIAVMLVVTALAHLWLAWRSAPSQAREGTAA